MIKIKRSAPINKNPWERLLILKNDFENQNFVIFGGAVANFVKGYERK